MFVLFAIAALAWSFSAIRWSLSRRERRRGAVMLTTAVLGAAAIASVADDVRSMQLGREARPSNLRIRIEHRDGWWRLDYQRNGVSFTTANEMHVPAGTAVDIEWLDLPPPRIAEAVCLAQDDHRCTLVARDRVRSATFAGLWPPMWTSLGVIADPPPDFERWFRNETLPARTAVAGGPALFVSAGCGYCHVVRGVSDDPWRLAPDLTHFASHTTIGATTLPNRAGFLSGWIVNSRALKTDSGMPQNRVDPAVLHGLVAYLESLR